MTQISYPSEVVPGPPPITLEMPEGWEQVWAPDTLIAIRDLSLIHISEPTRPY